MRRNVSHWAAGVTVFAVLGATLTGCGDDEADPPDDQSSASTSAGTSESSDPSGSATGEPTEPTDSGEPVAGKSVELDMATLVVPDFYRVYEVTGLALISSRKDAENAPESLDIVGAYVGEGNETLESVYTFYQRVSSLRDPERLPDVEVDGVTLWHLEDPVASLLHRQAFGGVVGPYTFILEMEFANSFPAAQEQELVDAVLGSIDFKE